MLRVEKVSEEAVPSTSTSSGKAEDAGSETTVITEVYDFAGDEIKVERTVTTEEAKEIEAKEKRKENEKTKKPPQKRLGLGGALTLLAKKPKMSVLDKSNLDWKSFKEENNLKEELETFNRGKNGYLDKMEFLSRTDYREFEKEKAVRSMTRKPI
ncbi:bucentaur or craniofacial development [Oesophagostomum dentatum]|uniref:Craniofacial development protein 1 n=1 Tax=Oesophagostomum dentatum TaxID=61180 RepID=A0A0B1TCA9_OESDE|nr:bucentaur or craniofacial development [Oesophagostomum dentatum]